MEIKDIDWRYFGAKLPTCSNNEQTEFFKEFVKGCGTWGTSHQVEQQLAAVNWNRFEKFILTQKERMTLRMFGYDEEYHYEQVCECGSFICT